MEDLAIETVVAETLDKMRRQLFERGGKGLGSVARAFRTADFNGNKQLDREEFEEALAYAGIFITSAELSALFRRFDVGGDGNISYDEFLRGLKGDLNERRKAIVMKAFAVMDRDGSGVITLEDLKGIYNAKMHPEVVAGRMTEDEALLTFLDTFEGKRGDDDGRVTAEEFCDYYGDVSASVPSDDYFVEMMESCWMITESTPDKKLMEKLIKWADVVQEKIRAKAGSGASESVKLRQIFQHCDDDETGAVTIDEFGRAMERLGIPLARRELGLFFEKFDPDGSGTIDYAEFCEFVYRE